MTKDETLVDNLAKVLWNYLQLHQTPKQSDIIFCLCSHDVRVADRASELILDGYGKYLVFSGGLGKLTKDLFAQSEADAFANIAIEAGVEREKIIIENKSANTGEDIRSTYEVLQKLQISYDSLLLVQKPYMERRTFATFKKQWPGKEVRVSVTSPQLGYEDYMASGIAKNDVINVMVGDMQRIKEYSKLGFQIEQKIPKTVWEAFSELVSLGFDKHLIA